MIDYFASVFSGDASRDDFTSRKQNLFNRDAELKPVGLELALGEIVALKA